MNPAMKKVSALMLGTAIALSASASAFAEGEQANPTKLWLQINNHNMGVDNTVEHLEAPPFILKGVTYVPFALIAKKSGVQIVFDGKKTVTMTATNNKDKYVFTINSDAYTLNGEKAKLAGKLMIKNGRIVVPLRDVGSLLGWKVFSYDNKEKIIQLVKS